MELSEYNLRHEQLWQEWWDGSRGRARPVYTLLKNGVRWTQHTGTTPHPVTWRTKVLFHSPTLDITDNAMRRKIKRLKASESVPGITSAGKSRINIYLVKWHMALKLSRWGMRDCLDDTQRSQQELDCQCGWVCTHTQESKGIAMLYL